MLVISPVDADMRRWELLQDTTICLENGECYTIPAGFVTDFASVPRCLWLILPPMGKYGKAALLHDWFYNVKTTTRREADRIFFQAMLLMGVAKWKAWVMYVAVRLFGWTRWKDGET